MVIAAAALTEQKRLARAHALAVRATCDPAAGVRLAEHFLRDVPAIPAVVAGFWPLAGEIDMTKLLLALAERGHVLALPVTTVRGSALVFRQWAAGQALRPGRFGTQHPDGPELRPDMVLVPLLAFDRQGGRLGYGGGYYDRTLKLLPGAARIGCGFAAQEVHAVPQGPDDQRLDAVATELGVIMCRPAGKGE